VDIYGKDRQQFDTRLADAVHPADCLPTIEVVGG